MQTHEVGHEVPSTGYGTIQIICSRKLKLRPMADEPGWFAEPSQSQDDAWDHDCVIGELEHATAMDDTPLIFVDSRMRTVSPS